MMLTRQGKTLKVILFYFLLLLINACNLAEEDVQELHRQNTESAKITNVVCTGQPNNYTLSVTIESPDTGCDQYADWWEVFTVDSTLIYRKILTHSHVDEQPFTRSGGIVDVGPDEFIYVRAHMNNLGYGTQVFSGTVREDLSIDTLLADYAASLSMVEPLPSDCAF